MKPFAAFHHYLPVDDEAIRWGIYVTGAGRVRVPPGGPYPPPGHPGPYDFRWQSGRTLPEFQILLLTKGRGAFESRETGSVAIEGGTLMFLFPGVWHRYQPDPETGWTERWLSFNGELAHRFKDQGLIGSESAICTVRGARRVAREFDRLLKQIHANPAQNSILLSLGALALLATALKAINKTPPANVPPETSREAVADPCVAHAVEFIWTHSHHRISIPIIARALGVNRRTLERRFLAHRGRSILDEINTCRLNRAKRLLAETDLPIKVITHLSGFSSEQRMRATFVRQEGVVPSHYRTGEKRSAISSQRSAQVARAAPSTRSES